MSAQLAVSTAGIVLYAALFVFYSVSISAEKKRLKKEGKQLPKVSASFAASLMLCALVELLPFLIPLKLYIIVIVCLCGILGETLVLRERLNSAQK
ncbi:MAG: hypothetical protein J6K96_02140 [Treponema sp.]|nr:hypothetical protein [Treponema sp.]